MILCQGTRDEPICVEVIEQEGDKKHCLKAGAVVLNRRGAI